MMEWRTELVLPLRRQIDGHSCDVSGNSKVTNIATKTA